MTTKHSPLNVLKAQANKAAAMLAAFERGEPIADKVLAARIEASRGNPSIKFGIIMDDKTLILTIPWTVIRTSGEVAMSEYILKQMRESRDDA